MKVYKWVLSAGIAVLVWMAAACAMAETIGFVEFFYAQEELGIRIAPEVEAEAVGTGLSPWPGLTLDLLEDLGEWVKVSMPAEGIEGYLPAGKARARRFADLLIQDKEVTLNRGTVTIGEIIPPGLYTFSVPAGVKGKIVVEGTGTAHDRTHTMDGKASYTLYLPEGATVSIQSDGVVKSAKDAKVITQDTPLSGSGRFFAGVQVPGDGDGMELRVSLMDGAAEGYYRLVSFTYFGYDSPRGEAQNVPLHEARQDILVLPKGTFLEVVNATVEVRALPE